MVRVKLQNFLIFGNGLLDFTSFGQSISLIIKRGGVISLGILLIGLIIVAHAIIAGGFPCRVLKLLAGGGKI